MVKSHVIYKDYSKDAERTALLSGENLAHAFGKIARWYTDISWVGHTHDYAGSSTAGGAATSANKLNIGNADIGSETRPVYFNATTGKPVACAYSLNASVPANAVFTDTTYTFTTTGVNNGQLKVTPAGGTASTYTIYTHPSGTAKTQGLYKFAVDDYGHVTNASAVTGSDLPSHSHTLSMATDTGTSAISLAANTKYKLTAGGSTYIFTTPADTNTTYTFATGDNNGQIKVTPSGGTAQNVSVKGLGSAAYTDSSAYATSGHNHTLSMATDSGTSAITLAASTKYKLTAGGSTYIFTTPPNSNTTYTIATGDSNGQIKVTPSSGSAYNVSVKGLGSAAYTASTDYAAATHSHPYLPESTVTDSTDLDTYLTTGVYHIKTQTSEHAPTTNHATLFVDGTVGTPYQLFIPDVSTGVWYSRYKSGSSAWSSWLSLKMTDTIYTHPTYTSKTSGLYKITVDGTGHVSATAAVAAADLPSHTHAYLPLSGGTMTGAITFQVADAIKYNAASATYTMISFITGDTNGHGISIGGGGLTVLGSGESASALISALSLAASNETTYIASDNNIEFFSNCQIIGNRLGIVFDTSGRLRPNTNNTRTLGGTDYFWNKAYIKQTIGGGGGSWISARDNAIIRQPDTSTGSAYFPIFSCKTKLGEWSIGTLSPDSELLYIAYTTDSNYSAGTNSNKWYCINYDGAFSGSAAKWSTARTLTIGSTGKSVDGSGNVSWSLAEIGAAATSHSHSNYLPQTMVTTTPDINTYDTTGVYHISVSSTNAPVTQHSTLYVEANVGTHYQIFKPDNLDTTWYTRHKVSDGWSDWVALKLTDTVYTHPTYTSKTSGLYKITVDGTGHVSATAAVAAADLPSHTHAYIPLAGSSAITGSLTVTMGETAGPAIRVSNGTYVVGLHVGSGGVNHGIYDFTSNINNWMCYHNGTEFLFNGKANTAAKWSTARTLTLTGSVTGSVSIDGSGNVSLATTTNHTHSYLPLSGGTLTGNLTLGSSTQSTLPNCGITVHDIRSVNVPASGFNTNGRLVNFYFHSSDTPDTKWWSIMHVKGWTNDYCSWELAGTAHNDDARTRPLYVRTSNAGTAWGSWRKIYDSSNKPTLSELGAASSSHTHSSITGTYNHGSAVPTSTVGTGILTSFYNVSASDGNMPRSNNANAILQINKHDGEYDSQLGFSSNGNIYYRSANGSAFTTSSPWKQLAWNDEKLGTISDGSYWGMASPALADNVWIRTTSLGIIPYQSGGLNAGHQSIGTSSWYFSHAYVDQFHGCTLSLGSSGVQGRISIQSTTTASVSYNSTNPRIRFMNAGGDQNIDLLMCDYDSVRGPAALSVHGNQGGEYLLAPNISAWDYANNKWTVEMRTWQVGTTSVVGQGRVVAGNGTKKGVAGNAKGLIEIYSEEDGCVFISAPTSITTAQSGYTVTLPSSAGTLALVGDNNHKHTYIESKANYTFTSSTLPNSFDWGVSAGFVNSDSGFGSYGSVLTVRTYSSGGGTLQLYAPYSPTYGGTHLKARFGNYESSSGNSWTSLRELAWNDEKLSTTTVTGSPDLDTYLTTGIYTINTSTATHSPTTNYSTLFVDGSVGTPFQILKPDANDTTWYTRHRNNSAGTWYSWVALTLDGVPNTEAGVSAAINKLSTGSSTPSDNDYYVAQYAGGGTATTSYHRRPVSALFSYINSKLYKILWSGTTSCIARTSTDITLTTAIAANKYRMIKVVFNVGSTFTGVCEFRGDTLNTTNNIPTSSDATTMNIVQFKISSDGKKVTVGPGTAAITVLQIAGVYPL